MSKIKWKGGALLTPLPAVLVSCSYGEKDNLLTIAWTGILSSDPPRLYISVRKERASYEIIKKTGEFCVNIPTYKIAAALDYCGVRSMRDHDKFAEMKLTKEKSFEVSCPSVAQCPLTLECKVFDVKESGSHDIFMADIVAVGCDESLIDESGRMNIEKAGLISYAHGEYYKLGEHIGKFGFSVQKKAKR